MTLPTEISPLIQAAAPAGYKVNNSLRFRSSASAYLNRTPSVAGSSQISTVSFWTKRGILGSRQALFSWAGVSVGNNHTIEFGSGDQIEFYGIGAAATMDVQASQVFRDPSSWYHIVYAIDTTQATAANRIKLYVNGVQVTSFSIATYPAQNAALQLNSTNPVNIARRVDNAVVNPYDGYMAEVNFIDGQALPASSFGTYSANGVWQPARYTGTYGTNGFYLKFASFGTAAALGTDSSGNGNTWTVNNISVTAGVTYDPMTDSPTLTSATVANYPVLNALAVSSAGTVSSANLVLSGTASTGQRPATMGASSGKFYWEVNSNWDSAQGSTQIGISKDTVALTTYPGQSADSYSVYIGGSTTIYTYNNASATAYGTTPASPVVLQVAVDLTNNKVWFGVNNTWVTGNPSTGTTATYTIANAGTYFPAFRTSGGTNTTTQYVNFGQQGFVYTPPTGFVALNAYNLSTPTIANGATVMAATTYTGTGASLNVLNSNNTTTAVSFKPDMVWVKYRNAVAGHEVIDSVRGATNTIYPNLTNAEGSVSSVTAFNSNGFTVGTDTGANTNGGSFIGWQWQAGAGSSSSNTNGSITSTVSVNATAGFSVVTYTGTGATASYGHGLGVAPSLVISKSRNNGGGDAGYWDVYHSSLPSGYCLFLMGTNAQTSAPSVFPTPPTSTVVNIGSGSGAGAAATYVAYCWSAVAGYSAFGSYIGNASTDGPFVYTGFRPRFILIKRSDAVSNWQMLDTSRSSYNMSNLFLFANLADVESADASGGLDILSNGFKIRNAGTNSLNASGGTYTYATFAENPFKYALAR